MSWPIESQNGSLTHTIKVYGFSVGDVEDPDLYAADPLLEFEKTERYKWLKKHAEDVYWIRGPARFDLGFSYEVRAVLSEPNLILYKLKYE